MNDAKQRKTERLYRPPSVKLTIDGRTFTVHNLSVEGIGFMSEAPLKFQVNQRLSMTLEMEGLRVEMEGRLVHLSPMSALRSNLVTDEECYLCGISFGVREKGAREAISNFVDSRLPQETAR
jgi:hypothetical protein